MANVLILIPARMAATRLPGKPLAEIAGEPMIVHVLRRAQEAELGPVVVATDSRAIAAAVAKAGGEAVLTRADHACGSDRIFEALGQVDLQRRAKVIVNLQGDLPTIAPAAIAAALTPLDDAAVDIATLAAEIKAPEEGRDLNVVKVVGTPIAPRRLRALYFTAPPHRQAKDHSTIISGSTRSAAPRWRNSSKCRHRHWSGARGSNNSARLKPGCALTSRWSIPCRSGSTRRRIWKRPAPC